MFGFKKKEEDFSTWRVEEAVADLENQMIAYHVPSFSEVESTLRVEIRKFLNSNSNTHDLWSSPYWLQGWIRKWLDLMLEDLVLDKINNETLFSDRRKTNELQLTQVEEDLMQIDEEIRELEVIVKEKGGM